MTPSFDQFLTFIQKQWFERSGLAIALSVTLFVIQGMLVAASAPWWLNISIAAITLTLISIFWWFSTRPPKTPKDKIGFLVSITCGSDAESEKLKEDFLIPLKRLIKSGGVGSYFHFMVLPRHISIGVVDQDEAQSARIRSRAHFMLYGQVRVRPIDGKEHHVIDLEGIVSHTDIPDSIRRQLSTEFAELLPRKVNISIENDMFAFQFTSEWADVVAKYIIGISALLSNDLDTAEELYKEVQAKLVGKNKDFPVYQKLFVRTPIRLAEVYEAKANRALLQWTQNRDPSHIEEFSAQLGKVGDKTRPSYQTFNAISVFLANRNTDEAIACLKAAKNPTDGTWNYNMAFLNGYKGNLKVAARHYNHAALHAVPAETLAQIEDFICWVLKEEPGKYHLNYCLGLFNWKAKGDYIRATNDFQAFLDQAGTDLFVKEQELATQWIKELAAPQE
jgi:tetratricopeptide (TPR) repeat protein